MKLQDIINKIEQNQSEISLFGKFDDAVLRKINYKIRLDWNYHSNRMEGGTLTREETRSVMVDNIEVKGKPFKDVAEMTGHNKVVLDVLKMSKGEIRISEKRMYEIHKAIMHEDDPEKIREIGKWKTLPNEIINYKNEKNSFAQPSEVAEEVHELLNKTNAELDKYFANKESKHPLEIAAQFHIDYINIHPFYDGNGRTARILTNILLMACGYPALIIKDDYKRQYYQLLADIQSYGGKPDLFYAFIGERILDTQQLILDALEGKEIEEEDDIDKRVAILERQMEGMQDGIQKTKNREVMQQMLKELVEPLFRKVFEKVFKIAHLFSSSEFSYYMDGNGGSHNDAHELIENIEIAWKKKGDIRKIDLHIYLYKFRKLGTKAFDISSVIKIKFEDHKYQIELPENEKIDNLYHQILPIEKIDAVASTFVNTLFNRIEEQVNNHKNNV